MAKEMVFCETCRKDVGFNVKEVMQRGRLKGEEYEYPGKIAICDECGDEVYVAEIEDWNLKSLYDAYRQSKGIIPQEKINEIPEKYNIGKRPLSLLLGWGEITFSRFCEGYLPSKQYSDILEKIYDDPYFFKEMLEKNKDSISPVAYEKSFKAVDGLIKQSTVQKNEGNRPGKTGLEEDAAYIVYKCEDITPLALQKLLYYSQGFYFAFEGKPLFEDDCEAWVHGPVYRYIFYKYCQYKYDPVKKGEAVDESIFETSQKVILDNVINFFGCYSGKTLERFTHMERPWLQTRSGLPMFENSGRIIPKELIKEYFTEVKEKFNMLHPGDIGKYSEDLFEKIRRF